VSACRERPDSGADPVFEILDEEASQAASPPCNSTIFQLFIVSEA
jgi:hypothetical protein